MKLYLTLEQVSWLVRIPKVRILNMVRDGEFPEPTGKMDRFCHPELHRWYEPEVRRWQAAKNS